MIDSKKTISNKTVISPNLLPPEVKEELYLHTLADTVKKVIILLSSMLLFFWIIGGLLLWRINLEQSTISSKLAHEIDNKKLYELGKMNDEFKELRTLNTKVEKSAKNEYRFSEVLQELSTITPRGVALMSFETVLEQPGWVKIKGAARNRDDFLRFKKGLEESKFYSKVDSPLSNYVSPESVSFELIAQLKDWKPSWAEALTKKPTRSTPETEDSKE